MRSIARSHNDHWLASGGEDGSIMTHMVDSTSAPCHHLQDPVPGQKNVVRDVHKAIHHADLVINK